MKNRKSKPLRNQSIRANLQNNFILVAVLPTIVLSIASIVFGYFNTHLNTVNQLNSLIDLEDMKINSWIQDSQRELISSFNEAYLFERMQVSLTLQDSSTYYNYYKEGALYRLNRYLEDTRMLQSMSLVNLDGKVILSSNPEYENLSYADEPFFHDDSEDGGTLIVKGNHTGSSYSILSWYPVTDREGIVIGKIIGELKPQTMEVILDPDDLDIINGRVLLLDKYHTLLYPSSLFLSNNEDEKTLHSPGIDQAIDSRENGFLRYRNDQGVWVYGVYHYLPAMNVVLIIEQNLSTVLRNIFTNQLLNLLIIAAGISLAVFVSIFTARRIATPLTELAEASTDIASGNFSRTVQLDQKDEIGVLAGAFNSMASQLHGLVTDLEMRVQGRTHELQESNRQLLKQARQMETTSQVSREITSLLELDDLLNRIVQLIKHSFDYYHVNIFFLDKQSNTLFQRSSTSSKIPADYKLPVDMNSLHGKAILLNQAVVANDVNSDPSFKEEPLFKDTCAELVIPLRFGDQVIGTLDILHDERNAFTEKDVVVLLGLGDQIAIAIHNAQLYEKTQSLAVLEERNRMARELHDSISQLLYSQTLYANAGRKYLNSGKNSQADEYLRQLQESAQQALKEMRLMIYELRPSILETEGFHGAVQHRLETVERRSGVDVQFTGDPSIHIPVSLEKELYLIAQEALNNVLKHSEADAVEVSLTSKDGMIVFSVKDNGKGFNPDAVQSGLGLENIHQHALSLNGTIHIDSQPGKGASLVVHIPGGQNDR